MCAEGTSRANWIALISKLVLCNGPRIRAGNRFGLDRHQRIACSRTTDHFRAQLVGVRNISASLLIKKLPEASDVLFQLPHDQIASVSRQFEFLQNAWIANTKFSGVTGESDPLLGNRESIPGCPVTGNFTIPGDGTARRRVSGLPQFVTVRGGAYFFLPSLRALRYFAGA